MDVTIGQLLDKKYRIVRLLGEGGMGAVYEGENVRIHHRVAIKVLHAGIATNAAVVERFEREAQAAGRIGSDHIVEVFDLGDLPNGARYMVMEFLDGESLSARVARSTRLAPLAMGSIMVQLLEGLRAAHAAGIIHRDLKPDNIFLPKTKTGADFVKIVDFGVSKFNQLSGDSGMSMTRTGAVIGTPYYMSPEQARGAKESDHRSDLYSAAVVMFECVTGQVPFQADTFNELMFKIVLEPQPDPETLVPGLDPAFAAIIKKGMAREPAARYQTAEEFGQAISNWMATAGGSSLQTTTTPHLATGTLSEALVGTRRDPSSPDFNAPVSAPGLPVMAQTPNPQLGGTNNALASSTVKPNASKSSAGPVIAAIAAVVLLVGGGAIWALTGKSAPAASATTGPRGSTAVTTAPTTATPPTTPTQTAATASSAAAATTAVAPLADAPATGGNASADAGSVSAAVDSKATKSTHTHSKGAASADPKAPPTKTEIKGRTITTEL